MMMMKKKSSGFIEKNLNLIVDLEARLEHNTLHFTTKPAALKKCTCTQEICSHSSVNGAIEAKWQ